MKNDFLAKYSNDIQGVISCYDRIVIRGTIRKISYPQGMNNHLYEKGIKLKDITEYTNPLRLELRDHVALIAESAEIEIKHIGNSKKIRKETYVKEQIKAGKITEGLVCILSAMESCNSYEPSYKNNIPCLRRKKSWCLHYYFYFIDPDYGLCYMRVPTWCPFALQFYCNAHNWLAVQMKKHKIDFKQKDNAFTYIADIEKAQSLSDKLDMQELHNKLDNYAELYCPVASQIGSEGYRWTIRQIEYATDVMFKNKQSLTPLYDELMKTIMHTVRPDDVARFLGRKEVHSNNKQDLMTSCKTMPRQEMRRIKHQMGESSIKMYDKFGQVLRIETTTNNTTNFRHYRKVEHRDGSNSSRIAPVKKSIYSINSLAGILRNCNKRYLKFIAAFEVPLKGTKRLNKLTKTTKQNNRSYKGFNFFDKADEQILQLLTKGEFLINGFRNKDLRSELKKTTPQVSRLIKRLVIKGIIKRVRKSYKYYLTTLGRKIIITALNVKELFLVPQLNY